MTAHSTALGLDLVGLLSRVLWKLPRLEDAACIDHPGLHDPARDDEPREAAAERHERAAAVCAACPALAACAQWLRDDPRAAPTGVVAGHIRRRLP